MPYQTSTNHYESTKFIVTAVGDGPYTTIQDALDAANTEAIATSNPQTVFIRPGTYTENLTLYATVSLRGEEGQGVTIVGVHTPPAAGAVEFTHLNLRSATDILTTAAAGAGAGVLAFDHCTFEITNGYVFDMTNWTAELVIVFCDEISTNNGIINNTAGATVQILNSRVGISTNVFTLTGSNVQILNTQIGCPTSIDGAATVTVDLGSKFLNTLTLGGTATTLIANTSFVTGANTAISHGSANPTEISDITIDSSANPCIAGAGAGNLVIGSITYLDNATLAGGLTVSRATKLDAGTFEGTDGTFTGAFTQTAGAVNIGADAAANNINIGTGAAAKVVTVGNVTGASQVVVNSGTAGVQVNSTGTGDITLTSADDIILGSTGDTTLDAVGVLELNSSAAAIGIGTDADAFAINIGTGAAQRTITMGNIIGTSTININSGTGGIHVASTGTGDIIIDSDDTLTIDTDGVLELNSSGGVIGIGNDADANNINIGTGAAARTITIGNVTGATQLVFNSGTGGVQIASTGAGDITLDSDDTVLIDSDGVLELNSSAGVISIGNDDIDQAVNFATDGERTVTIGSTNGAASLALQYGTADFTLASATGTIMSALDTGEITYPLQPAFLAYNSVTDANQTGDSTVATVDFDTEVFDQNADFAADTFTAPVTGRYFFSSNILLDNLAAAHTGGVNYLVTSNRSYNGFNINYGVSKASGNTISAHVTVLADMDAADTAYITMTVNNGAKVVGIFGGATPLSYFSGNLTC